MGEVPRRKGARVSALVYDKGTCLTPGIVLGVVENRWLEIQVKKSTGFERARFNLHGLSDYVGVPSERWLQLWTERGMWAELEREAGLPVIEWEPFSPPSERESYRLLVDGKQVASIYGSHGTDGQVFEWSAFWVRCGHPVRGGSGRDLARAKAWIEVGLLNDPDTCKARCFVPGQHRI
jgi:hypothetical protein